MYLSNGGKIHVKDEKYYDYMDGVFQASYILSEKDIDMLRKHDIKKVEYTLNDKKKIKMDIAEPQYCSEL